MKQSALILILALSVAGGTAAQSAAKPSSASSQSSASAKTVAPDAGEIAKGFYRSTFFGFTYRVPYGWVDRTQEMNGDSDSATKASVMLGLFERPPQAAGSTINSSIIIAAENASAYPGLKHAAQYFGPLSEVTTANGLTPVNEAYDFPVDGRPIVRRDFMKKLAGTVTMHQTTLAWLARGYVVSFTFIGGSEEEVQQLIEALAFGKIKPQTQH